MHKCTRQLCLLQFADTTKRIPRLLKTVGHDILVGKGINGFKCKIILELYYFIKVHCVLNSDYRGLFILLIGVCQICNFFTNRRRIGIN